ncbi:hypothetical protein NDU88_006269 [Pleurodeles waltl]|uniref:Uncharacterized protein n=1 Tax=Pleurodeles waltl TaxID=8319 RepID=A0AAV7TZM6_PLEWA|nr:hypothetical protein NDU88_006269 [Pleurodeles waltl]
MRSITGDERESGHGSLQETHQRHLTEVNIDFRPWTLAAVFVGSTGNADKCPVKTVLQYCCFWHFYPVRVRHPYARGDINATQCGHVFGTSTRRMEGKVA